jgi:hypothetical protein
MRERYGCDPRLGPDEPAIKGVSTRMVQSLPGPGRRGHGGTDCCAGQVAR